MSRDKLDVQASHARRILDDPLFQGAWASMREDLVKALEEADYTDEGWREDACEVSRRLQTLAKFKAEFTDVLRLHALRDKKRVAEEQRKEAAQRGQTRSMRVH